MDNSGSSSISMSNIVDIVYLTPENAEFSLSENKFLQLKARVKNPEKNPADKDVKDNKDNSENKDNNEVSEIEEFFFERVFLHRAFPFDNPFEYISVSANFPKKENKENKEKETVIESKDDNDDKDKKEKQENAEKKEDSPAPPQENTTSLGDLKEVGIISNISVFNEQQQKYLADELNRKYFIPVIEIIYSVKDRYGFSYWEVKTNTGRIKFTVHDAYRNILKITEDRIMVSEVNGNRYEVASLKNLDRQSFRKIELFL